MTNRISTKRAFLTSLMALLLCFTMLLGTTYAWFTDSVTSTGNKIQAGTLDVQLFMHTENNTIEITNDSAPIFGPGSLAQANSAETLWEPGKTQVVYLSIKNNGSLALKYRVDLVVTDIVNNLNEALVYSITPGAEYGDITKDNWDDAGVKQVGSGINAQVEDVELINEGDEHFFALSVHMLEEAGNEYQNGSITFDMMVFATQLTAEDDSFDDQYDKDSLYPKSGYGEAAVPATQTELYIEVRQDSDIPDQRYLVAKAYVPTTALKDDAETVSVSVTELPEVYSNITVATEQGAQTYNVSVSNLKAAADITTPVTVMLRVGTGLNGNTMKLYHYDQDVTAACNAYYDGEYLVFETKEFSPYTVVFDATEDDSEKRTEVPVAIVTNADEFEADDYNFNWNSALGMTPAAGNDQQLDSVYLFTSPDDTQSVQSSLYKDWYCDYYVKLDSAYLDANGGKLPEGSVTLGGNYGGWAWVGFDNPEVDVNTWIPLLGSVLGHEDEMQGDVDTYWTYQNVVGLVTEFWCGIGVANGNTTDLSDAKFVVELRLTNPEDFSDQIAVNTVVYNFATGGSTITGYYD